MVQIIFFLAISLVSLKSAQADPLDADAKCSHGFLPKSNIPVVISSGRNEDALIRFREAVEVLFKKGGVLEQLGIELPQQTYRFLAGKDVDAVAMIGRHPFAHWIEGQTILQALNGRMGGIILEFVAAQHDCQLAYFRDTVAFEENLSILYHVIFHHIFAAHTRFQAQSMIETVPESLQFFEMLERIYREQNHDEVSEWVQLLHSLKYQQDLVRGTFEEIPRRDGSTVSVLQDIVRNLPEYYPAWKKELALGFERLNRHISGRVPTKIINEGFATLGQELLAEHTPYNNLTYALSFGNLQAGVLRAPLSDPYHLGLAAWRRVRARFNERPEIKELSHIERDRRFLIYATREGVEAISKMDSYDFIRYALDAQWVSNSGYVLSRAAESHEFDDRLWPKIPPELIDKVEPKVVVTNDPARVVQAIARQIADLRFQIPRIARLDLNYEKRAVLFGFLDEVGKTTPLEKSSLVATLFVNALILNKICIIRTVSADGQDIQVEVSPLGKVEVWNLEEEDSAPRTIKVGSKNTKEDEYQRLLTEFLEYQNYSFQDPKPHPAWDGAFLNAIDHIAKHIANGVSVPLLYSNPTVPRTIIEYHQTLSALLSRALDEGFQGKRNLIRRGSGVRVRTFPIVPHFQFDPNAIQKNGMSAKVMRFEPQQDVVLGDDGLDIQEIPGAPVGGRFWGPPSKKNAQGGGQGGGDEKSDDDAEPNSDPGFGNEPGIGGFDPSYIEIPVDLYAEVLATEIKLPNLRPKSGPSITREEAYGGSTRQRGGINDQQATLRQAFKKGRSILLEKGDVEKANDPQACIEEGLKNFKSSDHHIVDWSPHPEPEYNILVEIAGDMSGSMSGWSSLLKKLVYDLHVLVSRKYKKVVFKFVAFDGTGYVFESLDQFLRAQLGGGTQYEEGFKRLLEIQEDYPRAKWDRFTFVVGDLEDFGSRDSRAVQLAKDLLMASEFMGVIWTPNGEGHPPLLPLADALSGLLTDDPYGNFVTLSGPESYSTQIFRDLFRNVR